MTGTEDEDAVTPDEDLKKPAKTEAKPSSSSAATASQLQVTLTPEYRELTVDAKSPFHVRVSAVFQSAVVEENKTPLDVVCVLDNSGSMSGSKIENLKRAMEFVVSTLGEKDRLSIVTFNSSATVLQGMWKMGEGRKEASRTIVRSISAGGGTDIYRGMQQGWQVLQNRKTKNPASCMFLLTDGQDGSFLEEKKQLAKTMRENGTALFIFGFGNDHDAAHLIQISNAAEGSFIYVETNDTVIDAFGGAIGTQQGQLLRDIQVTVAAQAPGVSVQSVQSGSYPSQVSADRLGGQVTLADLYGGEKRDFLLQLSLPAVSEATDSYPLLAVSVSYKMYGSEEVVRVPAVVSSIRRLSREVFLSLPSHERDLEVDVQVQRLDYTRAMQEAMREADGNNFGRAKEILAKMKTQLLESVSFKAANSFATGMLDDLNECERKISSREAYESGGGRAMMSECNDMYSRQRAVFSKGGRSRNTVEMQCTSSNVYQERATASKSSALSKPHP
jgi:Mg-chelatase subunit ChlD